VSSSYWDRNGGQSRTNRRSYDARDDEEDNNDQETDCRTIYEEEDDDPDSSLLSTSPIATNALSLPDFHAQVWRTQLTEDTHNNNEDVMMRPARS